MREEVYQWIIAGLAVALIISITANVNLRCETDCSVPEKASEPTNVAVEPTTEKRPLDIVRTDFSTIKRKWGPPTCESERGDFTILLNGSDISSFTIEQEEDAIYLNLEVYDGLNPLLGYEVYLLGKKNYQLRVIPGEQFFFVEQEKGTPTIFEVIGSEKIKVGLTKTEISAIIPQDILDLGSSYIVVPKVWTQSGGIFDETQCKSIEVTALG